MENNNLSFFSEDVDFELTNLKKIVDWIENLVQSHGKILGELTYVFCSDEYLLKINQEHLNHDTLTDIITFDYTANGILSGDIFISIDRVTENATTFGVTFDRELYRVMSHGILHLAGFNDKTKEDQKVMTQEENKALNLLS